MVRRKVIWSKQAYNQRREVLNYWSKRNGNNTYSKKLLSKINDTTKRLANFSYAGKLTDLKGVYIFIMGNYSIFYQVNKMQIEILCFWDNRRNPSILDDLL
ncbi:MAG: type II toxin-antitoxin system RelE/ParE family toxin [Flavobacteriales bacterium]|nr:type II toxin-antitoxin system RelE/ParE family toxin [Flavobacteriales bacterium]